MGKMFQTLSKLLVFVLETKRGKTEIQQLEDELQLIGQKMQYYYSQQQELRWVPKTPFCSNSGVGFSFAACRRA